MIDCLQARSHLAALLYGDLNGPEAVTLRAHLESCPACRSEYATLERVRQTLNQADTPPVHVDLVRLHQAANQLQQSRLRRWRRVAVTAAALAALLLLAFSLSLEVRWEAHQLVVRWGHPSQPTPAPSPPTPTVVSAPAGLPANLVDDVAVTKELVRLLAADLASRDQRQQQAIVGLQLRVEVLQRQSQQRWAITERDVNALYTAYFGSKEKGANP